MPFTLSHPAAVLPLARTKLVFSAMVAGALAPDIGHFVMDSSLGSESHSLPGLFSICLPVGLVMLLLFHKLLKSPLLALLPTSHQVRLYPYAQGFRFMPLRRFALIVFSVFVGSVTHLMWDSFTHDTGWVVVRVQGLRESLLLLPHHAMPVYKVLQLGSTVAGLLILAVAYLLWFRKAKPSSANLPKLSGLAKVAIAFSMLAGATAAALLRTTPPVISRQTIRPNVVNGGVTFVSAFVLEAIVFGLLWHFSRDRDSGLLS